MALALHTDKKPVGSEGTQHPARTVGFIRCVRLTLEPIVFQQREYIVVRQNFNAPAAKREPRRRADRGDSAMRIPFKRLAKDV
ncbi:hypothetical protein MSAS_56370 [Mycobacterium saskatchewanense]|nr:hypothetical protein MSAS_56370 [Mycobacterium saskatchewanense]